MIGLDTPPFPFRLLLPETCVAGGMIAALLTTLVPALQKTRTALWLAIAAALGAFVATLIPALGQVAASPTDPTLGSAFGTVTPVVDMLHVDRIAAIARAAIAACLVLLLLARTGDRDETRDTDAWAACTLAIGLGALLVAAASSMLTLWLGLELISLGSYALAAWRAADRRAAEAGMKYVLFGGAASGLMLFGISHLYGLTGHFDFAGIGQVLGNGMTPAVVAALGLAATGIAYKLTVVPFHVYAPDVYHGAPPLGTAVVATLPKLAAGAVLLRAIGPLVLPSLASPSQVATVLAGVAIASLVVGAMVAVVQTDARRILAFSGIGHGGTAVLAVAALPGSPATAAALMQLGSYAIAALGAFVCLAVLERDTGATDLRSLAGAGRRHPWVTGALCLFLASLAGIPPLAGFLGKWAVLGTALRGGPVQFAAAMVLLATTAVFAWAYLKIVRAAVLAPATDGPADPVGKPVAFVLAVAAVVVVGMGLWLDGLAVLANHVQG